MIKPELYRELQNIVHPYRHRTHRVGHKDGKPVYQVIKPLTQIHKNKLDELRKQIREKRALDRFYHMPMDGKETYERSLGKIFKSIKGYFTRVFI